MAAPSQVGLSTAGKVFFGSLCAGTFGLGCWQTQRLFQKQRLVESRQADLALEPTTTLMPASGRSNFRRVLLTGTFIHDQQVLVGPRGPPAGALPDGPGTSAAGMSASPQGFFVVTPMQLKLDSNNHAVDSTTVRTVLVNRGWIPRHLAPPSQHELQLRARRRQQQQLQQQQLYGGRVDTNNTHQPEQEPQELQWGRPEGTVHVTVVPAKAEGTY